MTHWKLILAYDGTPYHGWQIQPHQPTVQGTLAEALYRITGERLLPQGSGRTDAGVHALGQVASFALDNPIPAENLHRALNRCLPPSIRVLKTEAVRPGFHARHSAIRKTYEYRIFPLRGAPETQAPYRSIVEDDVSSGVDNRICPPMLAPFVWPYPWPLDLAALNQAARHIVGTHNFTSFAAAYRDLSVRNGSTTKEPGDEGYEEGGKSLVRTIYASGWSVEGDLLVYRIAGSGFLYHMVRNLVGAFVRAGSHRLDPEIIPGLLAARDRTLSGPTAPASGLFLVSVEYAETDDSQGTVQVEQVAAV